MLQVALNGTRSRSEHPGVPLTSEQVARDVVACLAAGATEFHVHPRDAAARETLEPATVDALVERVRAMRPDVLLGVTTGAWIEPDPARRVAAVSRWRNPRYTSVNVSEPDWIDVARSALAAGIGVEAGVWSVDDALALASSGLGEQLTRVLVEPPGLAPAEALTVVADIHAALDRAGVAAPRLQHGDDASAWVLLDDAARRGLDTRIGLEDTLLLPDGSPAPDNATLVRAAVARGAAN